MHPPERRSDLIGAIRDLCMQTHFDLFQRGSFNSDSQVLSRLWRVRGDANGLNLDSIGRQALKRKESIKVWVM
jgi:hypothetical protein